MMNNTKNKPIDLHNHLFEQLERLNDDDLKGEDFGREERRARAMCNVAAQIIANRNQILCAARLISEFPDVSKSLLMME
jgi:hypothetical protein